jgi:pimeloyl-ACP methyl ester carboxylesterase
MAKLMSKKTKETVKTTVVLVLIALFVIFYVIYPLNVIDDMTARVEPEKYTEDVFVFTNEPTIFADFNPPPDTFTVTTNDNLALAGLHFGTHAAKFDSSVGTVILVNPGDTDRTYFHNYIMPLLDSGLAVIIYDQRASGQSGGVYHAGGVFEGEDLQEVLAVVNFHGWLNHPLVVAGFDIGADAAINAAREDGRIDKVIAVNPHLTTTNWIQTRRIETGKLGLPLANMTYFWWYKKSSGFPYDRNGLDDILPLDRPCLILADAARMEMAELIKFKELDSGGKIIIAPSPADDKELINAIRAAIAD